MTTILTAFRRHDNLLQMALTLIAAVLIGAVLEAEAIHTWAQRLTVGPLRAQALPLAEGWATLVGTAYLDAPRRNALQAKAELAPALLPVDQTPVAMFNAIAARVPTTVSAVPTATREPSIAGPHEVEVVLAGDSMMAVGLAPTIKRWLAEQHNVHVIRAYRSGTGLARPDIFDWTTEYPLMLGKAKPDMVICSMGANDAQSVQIEKKVLPFGTPEWDDYFRERLVSYLDIVTREQPQVLWIGLPDMRSTVFAAKITHMNALIKATLERYPNTTWLDPAPRLADGENKGFQQFRTNAKGKLVKIRADDGIHLTDDGAMYLLDPIQGWFAQALAANAATKQSGTPVRPLAAVTPPATPQ